MTAKFGPAGNSDAFYEAGNKATLQIPGYLESLGLTAYEYQCGPDGVPEDLNRCLHEPVGESPNVKVANRSMDRTRHPA